jgi:hypothetical protein
MLVLLITFFVLVILASFYYAPLFRKHIIGDHAEYLYYTKIEHLLTEAEHEFLKVLEEAVAGEYYIAPKVQLLKLLQVERDRNWEYTPVGKIHLKSIDFVLFNKKSFSPHLAIELDETSHGKENSHSADHFLDTTLNKVGIRIVHIKKAHSYDVKEIAKLIS